MPTLSFIAADRQTHSKAADSLKWKCSPQKKMSLIKLLRHPAGFPDSLAPCPAFGVAARGEVSLGRQRNMMLRAPRVMALLRLWTGCAKPGQSGGIFSLMSPQHSALQLPLVLLGPWGILHGTCLLADTKITFFSLHPTCTPAPLALRGWRTPTQSDCGSNLFPVLQKTSSSGQQ